MVEVLERAHGPTWKVTSERAEDKPVRGHMSASPPSSALSAQRSASCPDPPSFRNPDSLPSSVSMCVGFWSLDHPEYALFANHPSPLCQGTLIHAQGSCARTGTSTWPDRQPPRIFTILARSSNALPGLDMFYLVAISWLGGPGWALPDLDTSQCCE
jgi:hypothetical protein